MNQPHITFNQDYYNSIMNDYGYSPINIDKINFTLGNLSKDELNSHWLCHHEGDAFSKIMRKTGKGIIATGFGMSGMPHIGTLSQIMHAITLQKGGIPVSLVLGDLDAYNNKNTPLSYTQELADRYERFISKLGVDNQPPSILRRQINDYDVLRTSYYLGRFIDDDLMVKAEEDLYGKYVENKENYKFEMMFRRKLSLTLMTADFLNLYFREGYKNVMVMLGIDEHRYVLLAREIANRMSNDKDWKPFNMQISGLYTPIIKGFNNHPKMSKSVLGSGITVDMEADTIRDLVMNAEGKYKYPEDNVVYQMMSYASYMSYRELARAHMACQKGGALWEKEKERYADMLISICAKWE